MKSVKVFIVLSLVIGLWGTSFGWGQTQEELDKYGKVYIQVIDMDTGAPVNEVFKINIYNSFEPKDSSLVKDVFTDDKGFLELNLGSGAFYMQFLPESCNSKYEMEPSPIFSERNRQSFVIEAGKITKIVKKVNYGGSIKVVIVDSSGKKIIPSEIFTNYNNDISLHVESLDDTLGSLPFTSTFSYKELICGKKAFSEGEVGFGRLAPGKYKLQCGFGRLGYKSKTYPDVQVSRKQTTTLEVLLDINNKTGVEGYVLDESGNPIKDIIVDIKGARCKVSSNGYYRLVGLDTGPQLISVHSDETSNDDIFINEVFQIEIEQNKTLRKDFVIKDYKVSEYVWNIK